MVWRKFFFFFFVPGLKFPRAWLSILLVFVMLNIDHNTAATPATTTTAAINFYHGVENFFVTVYFLIQIIFFSVKPPGCDCS